MELSENESYITELFKSSQVTSAVHQKNAVLLKKFYLKIGLKEFLNAFKRPILYILNPDYKQSPFLERIFCYIAQFVTELNNSQKDTEDPLFEKILIYLLNLSDLEADISRYRICRILNKIFDTLIGVELSDNICDELIEKLLPRVSDSKATVRCEAVQALHRLQDPSSDSDPIILQFMTNMQYDLNAKVRQICVEKVAGRRDVLTLILQRLQDVDPNVRLAALKKCSKYPKALRIFERRQLIRTGFFFKTPKVEDFIIEDLIPSWLEFYDSNVLTLLKACRLDADENDIKETVIIWELLLDSLLKTKPIKELCCHLKFDEEKLINLEELHWEEVFVWRYLIQFMVNKEELQEELVLIFPEIVNFCKYINRFVSNFAPQITAPEFLEQQFILQQLFLISKCYDFDDPAARQCVNELVSSSLEKFVLSNATTDIIISNLSLSIPNIEQRCLFVSEIISRLINPIDFDEEKEREREFEKAKIKMKLAQIEEDLRKALQEENYLEADKLKQEMEVTGSELARFNVVDTVEVETRTDFLTVAKCLDIAIGLLSSSQLKQMNSALEMLKNEVIQPNLINEDDTIRAKAMKCYTLCCIIDRSLAKIGINIFSTPIFAYKSGQECEIQVLIPCINACVDLIRLYGSYLMPDVNEVLSESTEEEQVRIFTGGASLTDIIEGMLDLMDDEQEEIQEVACRGLCSLLYSGRVQSPALLSRLILKWCNPVAEEGCKIKQMIGNTLNKITGLKNISEQLEGAVLMTVKSLVYAPRKSPLADVNIDTILKFMISLCKVCHDGEMIMANLLRNVSSEIVRKPSSRINDALLKMLLLIDIPKDHILVQDLVKVHEVLDQNLRDKKALNNLAKFKIKLDQVNVVKQETEE